MQRRVAEARGCWTRRSVYCLWVCEFTDVERTNLPIFQASPGNLSDVEDLLFGSVDILTSPVVAAVTCSTKASTTTVGVALTDSSERALGVAEFVDNEVCFLSQQQREKDADCENSYLATSKASSFSKGSKKS